LGGITFAVYKEKNKLMKLKTILPAIITGSVVIGLLTACDNASKGDRATITEEQKVEKTDSKQQFVIDTADSKVRFIGYGVGKNHPGKFRISSGTVSLDNNQITGGSFIIDIVSMELEQKGEMFEKKLRPHLLSGDFFDAEKFKTAKFEITHVEPYKADSKDTSIIDGANFNISGNLTIKDVTKNITFPAKIDLDGDVLKGKADFDVDRTQWKMNYGNDKTLGDKFISEKVNIELDLKARPADKNM
jgi:polyisoprenoid-binding protein YceI